MGSEMSFTVGALLLMLSLVCGASAEGIATSDKSGAVLASTAKLLTAFINQITSFAEGAASTSSPSNGASTTTASAERTKTTATERGSTTLHQLTASTASAAAVSAVATSTAVPIVDTANSRPIDITEKSSMNGSDLWTMTTVTAMAAAVGSTPTPTVASSNGTTAAMLPVTANSTGSRERESVATKQASATAYVDDGYRTTTVLSPTGASRVSSSSDWTTAAGAQNREYESAKGSDSGLIVGLVVGAVLLATLIGVVLHMKARRLGPFQPGQGYKVQYAHRRRRPKEDKRALYNDLFEEE